MRKIAEKRVVALTYTDIYNLLAAVNLRIEACDENDEDERRALWERLKAKLEKALEEK